MFQTRQIRVYDAGVNDMLSLVLLIFALVFFAVALLLPPPYEPHRNRVALAGFVAWVLSELVTRTLH